MPPTASCTGAGPVQSSGAADSSMVGNQSNLMDFTVISQMSLASAKGTANTVLANTSKFLFSEKFELEALLPTSTLASLQNYPQKCQQKNNNYIAMKLLTWQIQFKTPLPVNTTLQKCKMNF